MRRTNLANMKKSEETEQIAVFDWAAWNTVRFPELKWLMHIPNGGSRNKAEGAKLKRMGVRRGVSDIMLPCPKGKYHGLWIEMKFGANTLTMEQMDFLRTMGAEGYYAAVCHDAEAAVALLIAYMSLSSDGRISQAQLIGQEVSWVDRICHVRTLRTDPLL